MKQWKEPFQQEKRKGYYWKLMQFPDKEYARRTIYPLGEDLFACFTSCPFEAMKVVILEQDPYRQSDQTHGLCFSVQKDVQVPRSLKDVYKKLKSDINIDEPFHRHLTDWTKQGVFPMNTVMSIRRGQAASYKKRGWETSTDTATSALNEQEKGVVLILWGSHARKKAELITGKQHRILASAHPSPLSASRGFFGNRPFSTANRYLEEVGRTPIDWGLSE